MSAISRVVAPSQIRSSTSHSRSVSALFTGRVPVPPAGVRRSRSTSTPVSSGEMIAWPASTTAQRAADRLDLVALDDEAARAGAHGAHLEVEVGDGGEHDDARRPGWPRRSARRAATASTPGRCGRRGARAPARSGGPARPPRRRRGLADDEEARGRRAASRSARGGRAGRGRRRGCGSAPRASRRAVVMVDVLAAHRRGRVGRMSVSSWLIAITVCTCWPFGSSPELRTTDACTKRVSAGRQRGHRRAGNQWYPGYSACPAEIHECACSARTTGAAAHRPDEPLTLTTWTFVRFSSRSFPVTATGTSQT